MPALPFRKTLEQDNVLDVYGAAVWLMLQLIYLLL